MEGPGKVMELRKGMHWKILGEVARIEAEVRVVFCPRLGYQHPFSDSPHVPSVDGARIMLRELSMPQSPSGVGLEDT